MHDWTCSLGVPCILVFTSCVWLSAYFFYQPSSSFYIAFKFFISWCLLPPTPVLPWHLDKHTTWPFKHHTISTDRSCNTFTLVCCKKAVVLFNLKIRFIFVWIEKVISVIMLRELAQILDLVSCEQERGFFVMQFSLCKQGGSLQFIELRGLGKSL